MKLHCAVAPDAGLWRLNRVYLSPQGLVKTRLETLEIDDQCHVVGPDCRVVSREEVEGGVGSEGISTGVV